MHRFQSPTGVTISYDKYGSGPPLILVHGSFSDHQTNWEFIKLASMSDWEALAETFFRDMLHVPTEVLGEMRKPEIWSPIVSDASASLGDLRAIERYAFNADRFRTLKMPVLLQVGTESPRELYVTDALAAVLPDARIEELPGQAHEAPTTAPAMYAESVSRFLV